MYKSKSLQDLNLIDSFLFSASTENPQDAEFIAKLIVERATGKKIKEISVLPEKQLMGIDTKHHGIRRDLYIMEYENDSIASVYDIEPNKYNISELPKRSRYNQAVTDVKLLGAGKTYKELPEYISIWILTEDPFGENRMLYTVRNKVEEASGKEFKDGVTKLFLYVNGELGGTESLKQLLTYFSHSNETNVADEELKHIHAIVENVKRNEERREHYMTWQEMIEFEKEEVLYFSVKAHISSLREFNISEEKIHESIIRNFQISAKEAEKFMKEQ